MQITFFARVHLLIGFLLKSFVNLLWWFCTPELSDLALSFLIFFRVFVAFVTRSDIFVSTGILETVLTLMLLLSEALTDRGILTEE